MQLKSPEKLKGYLLIQELTHRELAVGAGLKYHTLVGKLVRGQVKTAKPEVAARICLYLGIGIDDLWVAKSSGEARQAVAHYETHKARKAAA